MACWLWFSDTLLKGFFGEIVKYKLRYSLEILHVAGIGWDKLISFISQGTVVSCCSFRSGSISYREVGKYILAF